MSARSRTILSDIGNLSKNRTANSPNKTSSQETLKTLKQKVSLPSRLLSQQSYENVIQTQSNLNKRYSTTIGKKCVNDGDNKSLRTVARSLVVNYISDDACAFKKALVKIDCSVDTKKQVKSFNLTGFINATDKAVDELKKMCNSEIDIDHSSLAKPKNILRSKTGVNKLIPSSRRAGVIEPNFFYTPDDCQETIDSSQTTFNITTDAKSSQKERLTNIDNRTACAHSPNSNHKSPGPEVKNEKDDSSSQSQFTGSNSIAKHLKRLDMHLKRSTSYDPVKSNSNNSMLRHIKTKEILNKLDSCADVKEEEKLKTPRLHQHQRSHSSRCLQTTAWEDAKNLDDNVFQSPASNYGASLKRKRQLIDSLASSPDRQRTEIRHLRSQLFSFRLGSLGDKFSSSPPLLSHRDIRKICLKRLIGSGGFGSVYLGVYKERMVAVKKLHKHHSLARSTSLESESNMLRLKHPNMVRVLAVSARPAANSEHAIVVMEFAGEINLLSLIDNAAVEWCFQRRAWYSLDVSRALQYLHRHQVVHLDLKPANVIVTSRNICKLADFGCCQNISSSTSNSSESCGSPPPTTTPLHPSSSKRRSLGILGGTFAYRAPELLKGDLITPKADVYSLGITMWQMLSRVTPYSGEDQHVVIFGVVSYHVRPSLELCQPVEEADQQYVDLFQRCWTTDLYDRPSSDELVEVLEGWVQTGRDVKRPRGRCF